MKPAYLALAVHAHIPFPIGPEMTAKANNVVMNMYVPFLELLERLHNEQCKYRFTIAISPNLISWMEQPQYKKLQLISRFKILQDNNRLELIACGATNALLPMMKTEESIRAQISYGVNEYERVFDRRPRGIWLPQCAFTTGVDRILKEQALQYFYVDSNAILHASPRPNQSLAAPLLTPYGVSAFGRYNGIDFFSHYSKYAEHWNPYIQKEIDLLAKQADRQPILVNLIDVADLESVWDKFLVFIESVCRQHAIHSEHRQLATATDYLQHYPMSDTGMLSAGSLGRGGYLEAWMNPATDWIYRHLHEAEEQMINHANCFLMHKLTKLETRVLNQASRELLMAQSIDWADMIDKKHHLEEATTRFKQHILHLKRLLQMIGQSTIDATFVKTLELNLPVLPAADFRIFASHDLTSVLDTQYLQKAKLGRSGKRILMLAWEFPPLVVGGLARAVFDLSKHLVAQGHDIHVVTTEVEGSPAYEFMDGIHVHRMHVLRTSNTIEFLDWVFQMNTAFIDFVLRLRSLGKMFDVIHAHDWLVYYAARELKYSLNVPLVATIHATEHGRNHGKIDSPIQHRIAELEWNLTYEASHVIICSRAMENEVKHIFQLPPDKVSTIHNGVDLPHVNEELINWTLREKYAMPGEKIIFYIGRLVYEKGIQVLIEAMPHILRSYSSCKLIIAGAGGMKDDLQRRAAHLGHKVLFVGFIDDATRNFLLRAADICVFPSLYEPFGIVALEAMHTGTPVVVSDVGGLAEIIDHGKDGYKALPGHVESLSWHIADMLHHPDKAKQMAALAKHKTVNLYNWKQIAKRTAEVYEIAAKRMNSGG
jgi:1,4-alpha-glucan branching enzyme